MTDVANNTDTDAEVEDGVYRGQIDFEGDTDWIAVEMTAGVLYTLKGTGSDSDNGTLEFVGILGMYDSNGNDTDYQPGEFQDGRQAEIFGTTQALATFTPSVSGTYYVEVDAWGGGPGSYTLYVTEDQEGGNADETLTGGVGSDSILGGRGNDVIEGGGGNDFLDGEWGDDLLTGGAGTDLFTFYSDDWDDIHDGVANLWGDDTISDFDPTTETIHFAGRIVRNLDDLTITEVSGNTVITAAWGDSVTLVGILPEELSEANFEFRLGVRILGGNIEGQDGDDSLIGSSANDTIYGHDGDDTIVGGDGENYLRGFAGDDLIIGGSGLDIIGGEAGNDTINAGGGDDYILSNEGDDSVVGGEGHDLIETSLGNDTLDGGSGNDTLRSGRGDDVMSGGTGSDEFVIGRSWGNDTISDFSLDDDLLDFRGSGLGINDLNISGSGGNTIISDGANTLTLLGVNSDSFEAAASDLILEPGSVTSHYTEFSNTDQIGDATEEILAITSVVNEGGGRWTPDEDGFARVSYSFPGYESQTVVDANSEWWTSAIEPITPLAQYAIEQEIARIEGYTNLDLVWVEDYAESAGNIRLSYHEIVIGGGSTTPYAGPYASDVLVGVHVGEAFLYGYFIHELGHSLGFDDLPDWNAFTGEDYTIMSYVRSARYADAEHASVGVYGYMYADIAGLQYLYGVDTETTAVNSSYSYDLSEDTFETIFDAGGTDTISVYGFGDAVHINLTPGSWSNIGPDIRYEGDGNLIAYEPGTLFIMPNTVIENAEGAGADDTLTGNDADNKLTGNEGDDQLWGGAGNDRLFGSAGDDLAEGGSGNDTLRGDAGDDVAYGGDGNDQLWAGGADEGNDSFIGGAGDDIVAGGLGNDLLVGGGIDEGTVLQLLTASGDSDDDGNDTLYGGGGNDTLLGGGWDDGAVNDNGVYNAGEEVTDGSDDNQLWAGVGDDLVHGAAGDDVLGGGLGDDTLMGGAGADTIYGGADAAGSGINDVIVGGAGADVLFASGGNDSVDGGDGGDLIFGGLGDDTIVGGSGNDDLYSAGGNDVVSGGIGNDTLWGGAGDDIFTGGDGSDVFVFAKTGDDTVEDFNVAEDELRLVSTETDFTTADDVAAAATEQGGGLLIDLGGGNSLFLEGLSLADIENMTLVL